MKKILMLLVCLTVMFSVMAAGAQEAEVASNEPVELLFWVRTGDSFVTDQAAKYMELHPEVKIVVEAVGSGYGDLRKKFTLGIQSGDLPDISIAGWSGMGTLYDAGAIVDISTIPGNEELMSDLVSSFSSRCKYKGAMIAVPYQCSSPVLYYNKTLLEEAGATVPTTFAELKEAAAKCVKKDANGTTTVYGFNTPSDTNWYLIPSIYNFGGDYFDANGDIDLDTEAAYEVFSWWQEMVVDGIMPANQHKTAEEDFANGSVAFIFDSCGAYANLKKNMEANGYEVGVAKFPSYKNQVVNLGGNGIIMFTKDEKKQAAAAEFIAYLLQPEQLQTVVDKGYLPVTNSALESDYVKNLIAEDENVKVVYDQVEDIGIFIQHAAYSTSTSELAKIASAIETYGKDANIKELLTASQKVIDDYMAEYK